MMQTTLLYDWLKLWLLLPLSLEQAGEGLGGIKEHGIKAVLILFLCLGLLTVLLLERAQELL